MAGRPGLCGSGGLGGDLVRVGEGKERLERGASAGFKEGHSGANRRLELRVESSGDSEDMGDLGGARISLDPVGEPPKDPLNRSNSLGGELHGLPKSPVEVVPPAGEDDGRWRRHLGGNMDGKLVNVGPKGGQADEVPTSATPAGYAEKGLHVGAALAQPAGDLTHRFRSSPEAGAPAAQRVARAKLDPAGGRGKACEKREE